MSEKSTKGDGKALPGILATNATLIAWLMFLGFGSAFLTFFYSHIRYFPELKWEESFSYLAAVSILGGGVVIVYGLLLFVPGWIWSEFLIFDAELVEKGTLCYYSVGHIKRIEPCFWSISRHLALPFTLLMVALHLALSTGDNLLLIGTTIIGVLAVAWYSLRQFQKELGDYPLGPTTASLRSLLLKYVMTASIAVLSGITSLFILNRILDASRQSPALLTICTIGVVVSNFLVGVQFRQKPTRAVVTSIVAAMALMICGETFSDHGLSLSEQIMSRFGVGETSRVSLDLTDDGAAHLQLSGLAATDLALLSRLGEEYLVGGIDKNHKARRIALKKGMVMSWSSLDIAPPSPPPFSFRSLGAAKRWVDIFDWALVGLALLWMAWEISRQWSKLKIIFTTSGADSSPAEDGTSGLSPQEAIVYVQIKRSLSVASDLGENWGLE